MIVSRGDLEQSLKNDKTATPLSYILQAAMGQCSTLPTEGRAARSSRRGESSFRGEESVVSSKDKYSIHDKRSSLQVQTQGEYAPMDQDQYRNPDGGPESMDEDEGREDIPLPPETATRTRCYKLNLDSEILPHSSAFLGPFAEVPPPLTFSSSDESMDRTPTDIAIRTAQIFRGITVAKDGTILAQNARATRSNKGQKNKKGEKSRQATKIEKAKDLVEETMATGKAPDSDEPAIMLSLVPMGEYDDMKYLVRDGSKKLREASEHGDEVLFAANRSRGKSMLSPRKRVSPNHVAGHRLTPSNKTRTQPQSTPPKLQGHPRDGPSTRRLDTKARYGQGGVDGDWGSFSRGFHSIWNCGGTGDDSGTVSPPHTNDQRPVFEGRGDTNTYGQHRSTGVGARVI